jgi:truncated hemoglobin YjbI
MGVRLLAGAQVAAFEGTEWLEAVVIADGDRVACDFARRRRGDRSRCAGRRGVIHRAGERDCCDAFVARAAGDDRINSKFGRTDIPHLKKNFADQLCEATGGPCTYSGRSMREAHDGMQVTAGEFDAFIQDLEGTLDELNVPTTEHGELLGLLLPLRDEIVEVESPETGTPLPDGYQAAP